MKSTSLLAPLLAAAGFILSVGATPGCNCNRNGSHGDGDGGTIDGDGGTIDGDGGLTACGDNSTNCMVTGVGGGGANGADGGFPLPGDPGATNVGGGGVTHDPNGSIVLDSTKATFDYLWIANTNQYGIGTLSKIDSRPRTAPAGAVNGKYREVARYLTVTCKSNPDSTKWGTAPITLGTTQTGTCAAGVGCCDATGTKPVQLYNNLPSRTAVDYNGDVWVANRAIYDPGPYQPSVTKVANKSGTSLTKPLPDPIDTDCRDRNTDGKIQTSSDVDDDGIITTDCNDDGIPDNASTTCKPGRAHEFYGLDDECVLFTTDTGTAAAGLGGRPLTLGKGQTEFGPSDAWAGLYDTGVFYRIDGTNGAIRTTVPIRPTGAPTQSRPYGAAIDAFGILWAPNINGFHLFFVDTNAPDPTLPAAQGFVTATSATGTGFYGIAIDGYSKAPAGGGQPQTFQRVWLGAYNAGTAAAYRFEPSNRDGTVAGIKPGTFSTIVAPTGHGNGRGVAVDNRATPFAWVGMDGPSFIGKIPTDFAGTSYTIPVADIITSNGGSGTIGVGVARNLDMWAVNNGTSTATHYTVDAAGVVTTPSPVDDQVKLKDNWPGQTKPQTVDPNPYTYSDFTGFGLRNFTNPRGSYTWTERGCGAGMTQWLKIVWDADVPAGTSLAVKARSADDPAQLVSAAWTGSYTTSPADLSVAPGPLAPNPSGYLQVEFDLSTTDRNKSPVLNSFQIISECVTIQR